ncbi:MAG: hypothetical protein IJD60_07385 [Clostridia bacterium]|nr:hypothetical protein [Clostridia bacterium]
MDSIIMFVKIILQGIGILFGLIMAFGVVGLFASMFSAWSQGLMDLCAVLTMVLPIAYIVYRCYEEFSLVRSNPWRKRFDTSTECARYLETIKHIRPHSIRLTWARFPVPSSQPAFYNRLYPQNNAASNPAPYIPQIEMLDHKSVVLYQANWPFVKSWDPSYVKFSMDYFYDWLQYHLPSDMMYSRNIIDDSTNTRPLSSSSYYRVSETINGRYIVSSGADDNERTAEEFGYLLVLQPLHPPRR